MSDAREIQPAKQARLPFGLMGPVVATMDFGQTYYTVPWAMWADEDGLLWLHPDYDTCLEPRGTMAMRVELQEDGYHVWVPAGHTYRPRSAAGFANHPSRPFIPVAELERDRD